MNTTQNTPPMKSIAVRVAFDIAPHTREVHTVTVVARRIADARNEVKSNFARHFSNVKIMHAEVR